MRYIAAGELGRLAKLLRGLGFDCAYDGGAALPDAILAAIREDRILLTRGEIPETKRLRVVRLHSDTPAAQLAELIPRLDTAGIAPFSRCLRCNSLLVPASGQVAEPDRRDVPPSVIERGLPLRRCPTCGKFFWQGSHVERMAKRYREWGFEVDSRGAG